MFNKTPPPTFTALSTPVRLPASKPSPQTPTPATTKMCAFAIVNGWTITLPKMPPAE